ncbi:MAG: DUF1549 domain-containing protein, partial [Bacteroidota bacterium]
MHQRFLSQRCFALSSLLIISLLCIVASCTSSVSYPDEIADRLPDKVDFNFHIKPILSDRCFNCHGQDESSRQAGLRLDTKEGAFADMDSSKWSSHFAIKPGSISQSEIIQRIYAQDEDIVMPPPESKMALSEYEKALLTKWIEQGAEWKEHWSFTPPSKATPPKVQDKTWPINFIDQFVLATLEKEGLAPSKEADKERLLRRVSMDLTGLPPNLETMDAFLTDDSADAYEKVVDQLLKSDAYAERMAMNWMDLSRYADSHGLHADGWRLMWPWRDWVIDAFKKNRPYDEFVTWQLAGDLLPNATKEQKLATAFNRNHPMTAEGGVVDEEFRLEYVFDRTNTAATVFLGLTMECARCHDHKFDPISQKEYYQMSAFFNNVKELGMTGDDGNYGPMLPLPDTTTERQIAALDQQIEEVERLLDQQKAEVAENSAFIKALQRRPEIDLRSEGRHYAFDKFQRRKHKNGWYEKVLDPPSEVIASDKIVLKEGYKGTAYQVTNDYDLIHLGKEGYFEFTQAFSAGAWIKTDTSGSNQTILCTAGDKNNFWRGWELYLDEHNRPAARLIHSLPHNYIHVKAKIDSIATNAWQHVFFTYDGSGKAAGLQLFVNGRMIKTTVEFDRLYKSILPVHSGNHQPDQRSVRVGKSYRNFTGESGLFSGMLDEVDVFSRQLSQLEVSHLAETPMLNLAQVDPENIESKDKEILLEHQLLKKEDGFRKAQENLADLRNQRLAAFKEVPEVMVMEEMPEPHAAHVLFRGDYRMKRERVTAGTPAKVLNFPDNAPRNRLGLAQWLMHKDNPLTARVAVNRYWQLFFGQGLVNTPQDFGYQGALPSHPALLDWLAVEFRESGWDIKALCRKIVLSATYRQSSKATPALLEKDPSNQLLARGPSHRLAAEMIRDNALAACGLLVHKVGGESVRPYQPEGLWIDKGTFSHKLLRYIPSQGDDLYRRSLYTFVKRTSPHPAMQAFDAPNRSICTVQRERT